MYNIYMSAITTTEQPLEITTLEQLKAYVGQFKTSDDPENVLKEVVRELEFKHDLKNSPNTIDYQAMSLHEFTNGILMSEAIPQRYTTFAIEMLRQLIQDYACKTTAEKSLAEVVTINFVRILDIQEQMQISMNFQRVRGKHDQPIANDPFSKETCNACKISEISLKLMGVLSKELDRANRHYLSSIQTLRMMKQSSMQVNIKTNTEVIGQNQVVQANNS